jgi:hypothetical protein
MYADSISELLRLVLVGHLPRLLCFMSCGHLVITNHAVCPLSKLSRILSKSFRLCDKWCMEVRAED